MRINRNIIMEKKIPEILRDKLANINLSKLSKEIGVSRNLLQEWARSNRMPTFNKLEELKKVFDYIGVDLNLVLFPDSHGSKVITSLEFEDGGRVYKVAITRMKGGKND